jgi:hypothetical protein
MNVCFQQTPFCKAAFTLYEALAYCNWLVGVRLLAANGCYVGVMTAKKQAAAFCAAHFVILKGYP